MNANNLRVRHHRARKQLRERLEQTCRLCAKTRLSRLHLPGLTTQKGESFAALPMTLRRAITFSMPGSDPHLLHHAAERFFAAAHLADVNQLVRLGFAVAFGHDLVFAAGTFVPGYRAGVRLGAGLGRRLHNGHPTVFAFRAGHHDSVARLNRFGIGNRVKPQQFGRAFLLRESERWQQNQSGDDQPGEAAGEIN